MQWDYFTFLLYGQQNSFEGIKNEASNNHWGDQMREDEREEEKSGHRYKRMLMGGQKS
jgi:hypothetical protein